MPSPLKGAPRAPAELPDNSPVVAYQIFVLPSLVS